MIKYCDLENGRLVETENQSAAVVLCFAPTPEESEYLRAHFDLPRHTLLSALDPEELARVVYADNMTAIIGKRSRTLSIDNTNLFEGMTFGCFLSETRLIVVSDEPIPLEEFSLPGHGSGDCRDIVLALFYHSTQSFHKQSVLIKELASEIEDRLVVSQNNALLLDLFNLQKNLTYYQNVINYNKILTARIQQSAERLGLTPRQHDLLDDLVIDVAQCYEQGEVVTTLLQNMTTTMSSMVGNKLNIVMKRLTVVTLIILPITAIASIGGMSEYTLFMEKTMPSMSFNMAYGLLTVSFVGIGYLTYALLHWLKFD